MSERMKGLVKAALIRAAHTMAQATLAIVGTAQFTEEVDWRTVLSAAVMAGLISLIKSFVVGVPEVREDASDE